MKAIEIQCPVEKCGVGVGQRCKLIDMVNNPMLGGFHQKRVTEAGKQERDKNKKNKEQDAKKLLRSTDRVVHL